MKYIRTKENVYLVHHEDNAFYFIWVEIEKAYTLIPKEEIIAQADTIEELCDEFVCQQMIFHKLKDVETYLRLANEWCNFDIYAAIWTEKGLIYVAKMNEKGELELL